MLDWAAQPKSSDATVQGSEAWLGWRNKGIGSSDAPALLGWSPWKTPEQLYLEKIGKYKQTFGPQQQAAMDRGKRLEPVIREWYEKEAGAKFPDATEEYAGNPLMRVSYDGICRDYKNEDGSRGQLVEIKAPNMKDHALAQQKIVPDKYIPQVQWQLLISGLPWAAYVSFGSDGTYAVVMVKEDAEMQKELLHRANIMLECMAGKCKFEAVKEEFAEWNKLPKMMQLDLSAIGQVDVGPSIADQSIEALVAETLLAQAAHEAAEAKFEALKAKCKEVLGDKEKLIVGEAILCWMERKGQVSYGKIPQLADVDLEPYRGKPTRAFYFKRVGTK